MKVVKFGGTSMADATQVKKVCDIIQSDPDRKVVVVSAAGKRNKEDSKITDLLYLCGAHVKYGQDCSSIFNEITSRYNQIIKDLGVDLNLDDEFNKLKTKLDNNNIDEETLVSRGEYFSARIIAKYLDYDFVDAVDCIKFHHDKSLNQEKTYKAIQDLNIRKGIVVPGFYGQYPSGSICTFTRGGSDITGSLLAAALDVEIYENWTDVSGILMADPRIVDNPETIPNLTFEEMKLLSVYGASVLHEGAVFPVRQKGIPLNIRNTNDPDSPGSLVSVDKKATSDKNKFITGISGTRDFSVFVLFKNKMGGTVDDVSKVLKVLRDFNIEVNYLHNGIDKVSVAIKTEKVEKNLYEITSRLQDVLEPDDIKVYDKISFIAAVGTSMVSTPGVSGKIFSALGEANINIRIINQGPDEASIVLGVENKDFSKVIEILYDVFVR